MAKSPKRKRNENQKDNGISKHHTENLARVSSKSEKNSHTSLRSFKITQTLEVKKRNKKNLK